MKHKSFSYVCPLCKGERVLPKADSVYGYEYCPVCLGRRQARMTVPERMAVEGRLEDLREWRGALPAQEFHVDGPLFSGAGFRLPAFDESGPREEPDVV
jgi:hypothetical protein